MAFAFAFGAQVLYLRAWVSVLPLAVVSVTLNGDAALRQAAQVDGAVAFLPVSDLTRLAVDEHDERAGGLAARAA